MEVWIKNKLGLILYFAGPLREHGIWQRRDKTLVSRRATDRPSCLLYTSDAADE